MQVIANYNDETSKEITDYEIIDGENLTIGQNCVTIKYENQEIHQEITVREKSIESISIKEMPIKQEYIQNEEELDLNGGLIRVLYNNKTIEEVDMTSELIEITGFDNSQIGKNTITLTYKNKTVQFDILIKEATPEKSSFENAKGKVKRIRKHNFTDASKKQYTILNVEISDIIKATENDKMVYQYYLSLNDKETNISNWVNVENIQEAENKLDFEINSLDCMDNIDVEKTLYLYIREIDTKNDIVIEYVTSSIILEINVPVEEFVDGMPKEELPEEDEEMPGEGEIPDEDELPEEDTNLPEVEIPEEEENLPENPSLEEDKEKPIETPEDEKEEVDSSIADKIFPNAGKSILELIVLSLIIGIGIFAYKKYKNIQIK